jgi:hypothetical protein
MKASTTISTASLIWGFVAAVFLVLLFLKLDTMPIQADGTFGDAFNGLLSPLIAFTGAVLVYLSFKEQIKANQIITSQWQFDTYLKLFESIVEELEKIHVILVHDRGTAKEEREKVYGADGLWLMVAHGFGQGRVYGVAPALRKLRPVTEQFIEFEKAMEKAVNFPQKRLLQHKVYMYYLNHFEGLAAYMKKEIEKASSIENYIKTFESLAAMEQRMEKMKTLFA